MKKYFFSFALALISVVAFGQTTQTDIPMNASIELADEVSAAKVTDVNFGGAFIPVKAAASVVMDGKGVVTPTGTTLYDQTKQTLGAINVQAPKEAQIQFKLSSPTVILTDNIQDADEGVTTLVYTPKLFDKSGTAIDITNPAYDFDDASYGIIYVGGSVDIPTDSYRGVYTGTFTVSLVWI